MQHEPTRPPGPSPTPREGTALRVVSYNIHHGADVAGHPSLDRIADLLADLAPDLVVLPEVDRHWRRSDFVDQPAVLADRLGLRAEYARALHRPAEEPDRPEREYGVLLLSRHPLEDIRRHALPVSGGRESRCMISAQVRIGGRAVTVAGVHLENEDAELRERQAEAVLAALPAPGRPVLLAGDFNATPNSWTMRLLTQRLTDTWAVAGTGSRTTFSAHRLDPRRRRIDYVLADGLHPVRAEVLRPTPPPSDHRPLVVDLEI